MRRLGAALGSGLCVAAALIGQAAAVVAQDDALRSGGIGLSRAAWEAAPGAGVVAETPAIPYGDLYGYEDGASSAACEGSKTPDDAVAVSLEADWDPGRIAWADARRMVKELLPADAELASVSAAPPTPGAPVALTIIRYESAAPARVPSGISALPPEVLVLSWIHGGERGGPGVQPSYEETVTRASLIVRMPEG